MKKNKNKVVAIALLLAFGAWITITVLPGRKVESGTKRPHPARVEPSFTKEAQLSILNSNAMDTLISLDIELAESVAEIQYGMMYRKSMDPKTGMLFIMGQERPQSFYMKNTYVSLDIIYINSQNEIVSIQRNAEPLNERSLPSEGPASLVLEVKGGLSDQLGLAKGNKVIWERI
ncbi:MAG: DUF192 domain-containing protein [Croceimicrobium sp.]